MTVPAQVFPELSTTQQERLAYQRGQARRSRLLAGASTVVFLAVMAAVVVRSPGWERVKEQFLDPEVAKDSFPAILDGFWLNLRVLAVCAVLIVVVGLGVAAMRTLRGPVFAPLRFLAVAYTDIFRGFPLIVLLYVIGFGVPGLRLQGVPTSPVVLGGVALVLTYSAYVAEVFRAGIETVHPSQRMAARSLGLTYGAVDAPGGAAAGGAPGDAAAAQRLRGAAEGRRADLGARCGRRRAGGPDRGRPDVRLHALPGRRSPVHPARRAHGPAGRLGQPARGPSAAGGRAAVSIPITTPVLEAERLVKRFGDNLVLGGVDLAVAEHEVVVLIGASGSGKSTLLRCVSLLEALDDGTVRLDGEEVTDPRADADRLRSRFGVVFQAFNLFPHLTVLQNVTLAPRVVHGVSRDEAEERAMRLLERVGLGTRARDYPDRLSGGQQQRVAIVRALANEPRMLLLDEVTSALDPELVGEVLRLVRELKEQGTTILMATHEMAFARQVADRVCFLDAGVLCEQGPPEQVLDDPREPRTRQFLNRVIDAGRL